MYPSPWAEKFPDIVDCYTKKEDYVEPSHVELKKVSAATIHDRD